MSLITVSWETVALIPSSAEGAPNEAADAGAKAEALSWAPNTRLAYIAGWKDFTGRSLENRCPAGRSGRRQPLP